MKSRPVSSPSIRFSWGFDFQVDKSGYWKTNTQKNIKTKQKAKKQTSKQTLKHDMTCLCAYPKHIIREILLLQKLIPFVQVTGACNFTKINTPPWVFYVFKIGQMALNRATHHIRNWFFEIVRQHVKIYILCRTESRSKDVVKVFKLS